LITILNKNSSKLSTAPLPRKAWAPHAGYADTLVISQISRLYWGNDLCSNVVLGVFIY
jgi:hypothetical protein